MFDLIVAFFTQYYIPIAIVYVVGGILYVPIKWVLGLLRLRSKVNAIDADAIAAEKKTLSRLTDEEAIDRIRDRALRSVFSSDAYVVYPPKVKDYKGLMFLWAVFWPINLIYTIFADVARGIWEFLYNKFGAVLQAIANSILPK